MKIKNRLRSAKKFVFAILAVFFRFVPLQNKVVFSNFEGRGLGDDCKYILLNLLKREKRPKLIWIVAKKSIELPLGVLPAKYGSIKYWFHMCTAKTWCLNVRNLLKPNKRKGQYYIQTWHGGILGLKKAEQAIEDKLPASYVEAAKQDSKIVDLFYTNNEFMRNIYRTEFFGYDGEIMITDVPRMKILLNPPKGLKDDVFSFFGLEKSCKIILYAPTFRRDMSISSFCWDYSSVIKEIEKKYGGQYVMIVRLHPNLASKADKIQCNNKVINGSAYPDMQELLAVSDVLISDYSSSIFEFGYMRKPVFLFAFDLMEFVNDDRPLFFSLNEIPFPVAQNVDGLIASVCQFNQELYRKKCDEFFSKLNIHDSGKGDERIADIILEKMS